MLTTMIDLQDSNRIRHHVNTMPQLIDKTHTVMTSMTNMHMKQSTEETPNTINLIEDLLNTNKLREEYPLKEEYHPQIEETPLTNKQTEEPLLKEEILLD